MRNTELRYSLVKKASRLGNFFEDQNKNETAIENQDQNKDSF